MGPFWSNIRVKLHLRTNYVHQSIRGFQTALLERHFSHLAPRFQEFHLSGNLLNSLSFALKLKMTTQHQINISRRIRTQEYAMKYNKDALQDDAFSYRSDIITTSLYCSCKDCIKFCCYSKPIKCIDPYLMDMRYTFWIYQGLVKASKTTTTAAATAESSAGTSTDTINSEEPKPKRRKH